MAKNEKQTTEKDLEQVSGGFIGWMEKRAHDQYLVESAGKEPKHALGSYVQAMKNKLEGKE